MNRLKLDWLPLLAILAFLFSAPSAGAEEGPVMARLDLDKTHHFAVAEQVGIKPFLRSGNVFFAEVSPEQLRAIQDARIPHTIVDHQPFSGHYYLGSVESLLSWKKPRADYELLADLDGRALYKTPTPIGPLEARQFDEEVFEIGLRQIPLVYRPVQTVSLNPASLSVDPFIEALIALVDQDSVYDYNFRLEEFQTRLTFTDSNVASRDWIAQKFAEFGYAEISLDEFWCPTNREGMSGYTHNIVCVKYGTAEPDKVVVIGGHYDSIVYDSNDPYLFAPGANDNASGVTGMLEIARVLAGVETERTIIFAAFGAEESGLFGSWHYAEEAYNAGLQIELMINMDMIGHTDDEVPDVRCRYPSNSLLQAEMIAGFGGQYTELLPDIITASGNSDHWPFAQFGYPAVFIQEGDFDSYGLHTGQDVTTRMNFEYETEVVKMCLAALYAATAYPPIMYDAAALDIGDGQSLRVEWTPPAAGDITGYLLSWGTESQVYPESVFIPGRVTASQTINGLIEDQLYYLTLVAVNSTGKESCVRPEFTGRPRTVPLPPSGLTAESGESLIHLNWLPNQEVDFDYYNIYRGTEPGIYLLQESGWTALEYDDVLVDPGVEYIYAVTAVDLTANESDYSEPVAAIAADFADCILIIDATPATAGNPSPAQKTAFLNEIFAGLPYTVLEYDQDTDSLTKGILAQCGTLFWYDDDILSRLWKTHDLDLLRWYQGYSTNLVIAGWHAAYELANLNPDAYPVEGNFLYDCFDLNHVLVVDEPDFMGAYSDYEFPDLPLDPAKLDPGWNGRMPEVGTLGFNYGEGRIFQFNSYSGVYRRALIGVRHDNGDGKYAFLSLPLYYFKEDQTQTTMYYLMQWMGFQPPCKCSLVGDVNQSGSINPIDVVWMVQLVYRNEALPSPSDPLCVNGESPSNADWNCDGAINPIDVVYFANFVYKALGSPCDPCQCNPYPSNCP